MGGWIESERWGEGRDGEGGGMGREKDWKGRNVDWKHGT